MKKSEVVERFRASMTLDYDAWHDGIGYDMDAVAAANASEKKAIAALVTPPQGWRDIQTLATLGTDSANAALRDAMRSEVAEVRTAVIRYAPSVVSDDEKAELLVRALTSGAFYQDMTSALQQIATFHPPAVIDAMFRALFTQSGDVACHLSAMLAFVHKRAKTTFDWGKRPLFLKFNTDDRAVRRAAFTELCVLLMIDEAKTLARIAVLG